MTETHEKRTETHACDLISRTAALDALGEEPLVWHEDDAGEVAERNQWRRDVAAIKALPSAQQWIPCSERLPRDDEEVIVNIYDDSGDTSFSYTTVGWHYKGLWVVDDERCLRVTAWMPLPAPYKGGDAT